MKKSTAVLSDWTTRPGGARLEGMSAKPARAAEPPEVQDDELPAMTPQESAELDTILQEVFNEPPRGPDAPAFHLDEHGKMQVQRLDGQPLDRASLDPDTGRFVDLMLGL